MNLNEPAGFWIRFAAMLLDALIVSLPLAFIFYIITGKTDQEYYSDILTFLYTLLTPVFWNGYTIGKKICDIRIVKLDGEKPGVGTMLMRVVVAGIVYGITLGIGVIVSAIMVGVREDKRALHDFIAGTEVVRA